MSVGRKNGIDYFALTALLCFSNWAGALKRKELYVGIAVKMLLLPLVGGKILFMLGWSML